MHHDHDALFRQTFGDPRHAAALLRGILPAALVAAIDWSTLVLVPGIAQQWLEEGMQEGLIRGKAEGRAEGRAELLLRQIRRRFGPVDPALEARVRAASIDSLDLWGDRILTAATLGELFA